MIDKTVHMMDAGTRLFDSEKPFGTVLGGIKVEMAKYGKVSRPDEIDAESLPDAAAGFSYFADLSTRFKTRYIACFLEDAGTVGKTSDGEEIHRYAVSLKEGNKNTNVGIYVALACVVIWAMLGWLVSDGSWILTVVFLAVGFFGAWRQLKPDKHSTMVVSQLLDAFADGK
ncbi:MAG: hypothetical protein IJK73_06305 [Bacteroidales bacterium]|nr:hypothetical protein [Bacteroidales bacterium]